MKKLAANKENKELAVLRAERARKGWRATDWYCEKGNVVTVPLKWHSQPHTAKDVGNCWRCSNFSAEDCYCRLLLVHHNGNCINAGQFAVEIARLLTTEDAYKIEIGG